MEKIPIKRLAEDQAIDIVAKNLLVGKICDNCLYFFPILETNREIEFCFAESTYDYKKNKVKVGDNNGVPITRTCANWKLKRERLSVPWDQ
jgi:hypothetical protein